MPAITVVGISGCISDRGAVVTATNSGLIDAIDAGAGRSR
jgi:hypothetical protein